MNSIKRLGVLYGRLGLSTDPALIARRGVGVAAVSDALERADIPPLVRRTFEIGQPAVSSGFLDQLREQDPTFDVQASDAEAALLAAAILDYTIENEGEQSHVAALLVVTASTCGLRRPSNHGELIAEAERMLTQFQGAEAKPPANRGYSKLPKEFATALETLSTAQGNYIQQFSPHVVAALKQTGKYAEETALTDAQYDNVILSYVRRLESELRLYWWVTGGWSTEAAKPFRALGLVEAAVRGGKELSDKSVNEVGLFAAPAMLDLVLERGRNSDVFANVSIGEAAVVGDRAWRERTFGGDGTGALKDLLAVTTAMHLAADSDDADDWHPRFTRLTGVAVDAELDPVSLGLQVHRERLVAKAFA